MIPANLNMINAVELFCKWFKLSDIFKETEKKPKLRKSLPMYAYNTYVLCICDNLRKLLNEMFLSWNERSHTQSVNFDKEVTKCERRHYANFSFNHTNTDFVQSFQWKYHFEVDKGGSQSFGPLPISLFLPALELNWDWNLFEMIN